MENNFKKLQGHKILFFDTLADLRKKFPEKKIVHCHGVFDVLHAGHLSYLYSAKAFGDILVVTVTADSYVNKGPGRPYFPSRLRVNMLAALEVIDFVVVSEYPTAVPSIEALKPDFYVKGPDYRDKTKDITGSILAEEQAVERHGGKFVCTKDESFSSSTLINHFFMPWTEDQLSAIKNIRKLGGESAISEALIHISNQKVLVVGEPIIDTYRFCIPENISSKSPSISARFLYEENYAGGSLAVANHLADFVKEVHLLITHGNEPYFQQMLNEKLDSRVIVHQFPLGDIPTPRKVRYIAIDKLQRIFEITDIRSDQWTTLPSQDFAKHMLALGTGADSVILADFGHGLFESSVLNATRDLNSFTALNVQTNSSNYGFNAFHKHKRFDYLSIDTREGRIAYHDRYSSPLEIGRRIRSDVEHLNASVAMTLGSNGSYFFPGSSTKTEYFSPAFADNVIDATGAGDAFFCLTSVLLKSGCQPDLIPFLGNIFAGLKTKIIGNKNSVTKAQLIKTACAVLK